MKVTLSLLSLAFALLVGCKTVEPSQQSGTEAIYTGTPSTAFEKFGGFFDGPSDRGYLRLNDQLNKMIGRLPWFYFIPKDLMSDDMAPVFENGELSAPYFPYTHMWEEGPDARNNPSVRGPSGLGLRMYVMPPDVPREVHVRHLAQKGIVKTGDLLLSFRQAWAGANTYGHVQLGLSHTGVAVIRKDRNGDDVLYNMDSPISYYGALNSPQHYTEEQLLLHVFRPTNMSSSERRNLLKWSDKLKENFGHVRSKVKFQGNYGEPRYLERMKRRENPMSFVEDFGKILLGRNPGNVDMYCSEFAWALLALRKCDPTSSPNFSRCVDPLFEPMKLFGTALSSDSGRGTVGLTDGPALSMAALPNLPNDQKVQAMGKVFDTWRANFPAGKAPFGMSSGHREQATNFSKMDPAFKAYWNARFTHGPQGARAALEQIMAEPDMASMSQFMNYSPTGFMVQALKPRDRVVEYVSTLAFPTKEQMAFIDQGILNQLKNIRPPSLGGAAEDIEVSADALGSNPVIIERGSNSNDPAKVKFFQCLLADAGLIRASGIDGDYGPGTAKATKKLKRKAGIRGSIDGDTVSLLEWNQAIKRGNASACQQYCPSCSEMEGARPARVLDPIGSSAPDPKANAPTGSSRRNDADNEYDWGSDR